MPRSNLTASQVSHRYSVAIERKRRKAARARAKAAARLAKEPWLLLPAPERHAYEAQQKLLKQQRAMLRAQQRLNRKHFVSKHAASKHAASKHSPKVIGAMSITTVQISPNVTETTIIAPSKHSFSKHRTRKHG